MFGADLVIFLPQTTRSLGDSVTGGQQHLTHCSLPHRGPWHSSASCLAVPYHSPTLPRVHIVLVLNVHIFLRRIYQRTVALAVEISHIFYFCTPVTNI